MHRDDRKVSPRSTGALRRRRVPQPWPEDRDFRILSIDGGGIKGIFPASFLAGLERNFLRGESIASHFDLVTGTSTGGIIALALGAGLKAQDVERLYIDRGGEIFPPGYFPSATRWLRARLRYLKYTYDRKALAAILADVFRDRLFGDSSCRLCIPAFEGVHSEVYIFKTPHHPDYRLDGQELMVKVACATSAAPTFYKPLEDAGYTFVDGGVWANNPVMIGLVDALTCFSVLPRNVRILSLGCGDEPFYVTRSQSTWGGMWHWRTIMFAAMRLQSLNALGQAGLLVGAENLIRVKPDLPSPIELDDWLTAKELLPQEAELKLQATGESIAAAFFARRL